MLSALEFHELNSQRWQDFQTFFEKDRVCGACWCMWWRLSAAQWMKQRGRKNREAMRSIVESGKIPGILAYSDGEPIGWCSISPREGYPRLERSRTLRRIDNQPVWSVVCFFVAKPFRRKGISTKLLHAAVDYARRQGTEIIEGYPNRANKKQQDPLIYTGLTSTFQKVGFVEVPNNSKSKTIMRYAFECS